MRLVHTGAQKSKIIFQTHQKVFNWLIQDQNPNLRKNNVPNQGQAQGQGQDQAQGHEKVRQRSALLQLQMALSLVLALTLVLALVRNIIFSKVRVLVLNQSIK